MAGPHRVATRFVETVGVSASALHFPVTVETEVSFRNGKDRIDILVKDSSNIEIVIENKVKAIPSGSQLDRYHATLKSEKRAQYFVIMSTAFDNDVRESVPQPWQYLGVDYLINLVKPDQDSRAILSDYASWLTDLRDARLATYRDILSGDLSKLRHALQEPEGQWELMRVLTNGIHGRQYRGVNRGGTPWTQFRFITGGSIMYDDLFLRIDSSSRGPYISVRQYQKPPKPSKSQKQERFNSLQTWWSEAMSQKGNDLVSRKPSRRGDYESEVGVLLMTQNTPVILQKAFPEVMKAFILRLSDEGWPVSV